jgi:ferredoxin
MGENPHSWTEEACSNCRKCIRECHGKAILEYDNEGCANTTHIDTVKCYNTFLKEYACGKCIKECTFSGKHYSKLKIAYDNKHKAQ